jgi:hypothetical protein
VRLSERAQALLFVAVLLSAIAGLWVAVRATLPSCERGDPIGATLEVRGTSGTFGPEERAAAGCTVFALLEEWAEETATVLRYERYQPPLDAVFVVQIGGDANGEGGRYWQFWVNCAYAAAGADLTPLHPGDRIAWLFVEEAWRGSPC